MSIGCSWWGPLDYPSHFSSYFSKPADSLGFIVCLRTKFQLVFRCWFVLTCWFRRRLGFPEVKSVLLFSCVLGKLVEEKSLRLGWRCSGRGLPGIEGGPVALPSFVLWLEAMALRHLGCDLKTVCATLFISCDTVTHNEGKQLFLKDI